MLYRTFAVFLALVLAGPAQATPGDHSLTDSQQLLQSCQSLSPTYRAMCLGYLAAIADDLRSDHPSKTICMPRLADLNEYRTAFIAFVEEKPELLPAPSYRSVKAALAASWPCR